MRKTRQVSLCFQRKRESLGRHKNHYLIRACLFENEKPRRGEFGNYFGETNKKAWRTKLVEEVESRITKFDVKRRKEGRKYREVLELEQMVVRKALGEHLFGIDNKIDELPREKLSELSRDGEAVKTLSSYVINPLVMMRMNSGNGELVQMEQLIRWGREMKNREPNRTLYYFTHLVIAASNFYSRMVPRAYGEKLKSEMKTLEKLIKKCWNELWIDAKLEYLLACKIIGYQSTWVEAILQEAERNMASEGYLLDPRKKGGLVKAEHRSMLYLGVLKWKMPWTNE